MNKKNLSVVMAGAMLATSVAPVLAATESTVSDKNIALLANNIKTKMESKKLTTFFKTNSGNNDYIDKSVWLDGTNKSAYGIKVKGSDGKYKQANNMDTNVVYDIDKAAKFFAGDFTDKLAVGDTVEVYERKTSEFYGELLPGTAPVSLGTASTDKINTSAELKAYVTQLESDISSGTNGYVKYIKSVSLNKEETVATVTLHALNDIKDPTSNKTFDIKVGDAKLDLDLPLNGDKIAKSAQECTGFAAEQKWNKSQGTNDEPTLVESIKVTADKEEKEVYNVSDLYDGFALTTKGTEIANTMANEKYKNEFALNNGEFSSTVSSFIVDDNGVCTLKINIYVEKADVKKNVREIEVVSSNAKEVEALYNLIKNGSYNVGILGGENRYETAVNVDKAALRNPIESKDAAGSNIVLVNGESLVDGLAAAPLAAKLSWKGKDLLDAPLLLTGKDKLPEVTKKYIEEVLAADISRTDKAKVTIHLVGGEAVLSENLVSELKGMGYKVVRHGGDNREETSIEVAKSITSDDAFVVGGNGEADAMSIAAVASRKGSETPIIVSNVNGISKKANNYLASKTGTITLVGGTSTISKSEEEKLDEVTPSFVKRISGENRFETNAAVIKEYYAGKISHAILLVKDGQKNKSELIDALSAANYAALNKAPIVLASKELKDVQKNELLKIKLDDGTTTSTTPVTKKVVQIGIGAERNVLESIAKLFNVSNI